MSKLYDKVCKCCGRKFKSKAINKQYCPDCGDTYEDKLKRMAKKKPQGDKLEILQREIDAYNKKHGTALSYGQYVMKFGK